MKDEMAACWKGNWKVEPLALMVPLTAALLGESLADGLVPVEVDDELEEEHAARATAATRAPPTLTTRVLPRNCILRISLGIWRFSLAIISPGIRCARK